MLRALEYGYIRWTNLARIGGLPLVAAILALTGIAGWYAARTLSVDTDTSGMLDPSLGFQVRAGELRAAFPSIKNDVVVVIDGETVDEAEAFTEALATRLGVRDDLFADVFAPSASEFFQRNGLLYLSIEDLENRMERLGAASSLIERLVASPTTATLFEALADNASLADAADLGADDLDRIYAELAAVAEASLADEARPFAWLGALSGEDEKAGDSVDATPSARTTRRLLYANPTLDYTRLQPAKPSLQALQTDIDELLASFDGRVTALVTGDPALRADELAAVTTGIGASFALSFILVAALLFLAFRSAYLVGATLLSLVVTIILTSAFAALAIGQLNLVSVAFTVLLVGLGLDFAIHLLAHVQERRTDGRSTASALRGAAHDVGGGLMLAAPTTAIGFFAFTPTRFDGIAQLGVIAGVGVLIAFFVASTLLPAFLGAFRPPAPKAKGDVLFAAFRVLEKVSAPVSVLAIAAGVFAVTLLPEARFDADPMGLRDPGSQSVRGFALLFDDEATVPYRASLIVADAAAAAGVKATAASVEEIGAVRSLADFVPADQIGKLDVIDLASGGLAFALRSGGDAPAAASPADRAAAASRLTAGFGEGGDPVRPAQARLKATLAALERNPAAYDRFDAAVFRYWPQLADRLFAQLSANEVDLEDLPAALSARYVAADGRWRVDLLPEADVRNRKALESFVAAVNEAFPNAAGGAVQAEAAGRVIAGAMLQATTIALFAVTLILWLLMRRIDSVLLVLFPIGLAAALTVGAGVVLDIPFNYANVIVLPLLLGIGVDSGIHLVMRERHLAGAAHGEARDVYQSSTPAAVFFSATTTVASFGSLMLSAHRGTASMGQLLSIAIAFTLVCTLIVLPAMLRLRRGRETAGSAGSLTES